MRLLSNLKQASLALGMYPFARKLNGILQPAVRRAMQEDIAMYQDLLPEGALCFDIGAHFGAKSETLLKAGAKVVAFEPNPSVFPELTARCAMHPQWALLPAALGNAASLMELNLHTRSGESSFDSRWKGGEGFVASIHVPVTTLDAAIAAFGKPYYCKIDVEGWEDQVLLGLSCPIPLISIEFHLNEDIIPRTIRCLQRLREFGAAEVNVTPAESSTFHLPKWMELDDFIAWFPGDLAQTLPQWPVGDIYIRLKEKG
ncbi:FkbM family methyltransferase [bacterium]|nr:FkbM family methyltransferase [bacterium]